MGKYYGGYPICGFFLTNVGIFLFVVCTWPKYWVEYVGLLWLSAHYQQVFPLLKMSVCV